MIVATLVIRPQVVAQLESAAPEPETADQVETTPSTEFVPTPITGTTRDDGSVLGGYEVPSAIFDLPRQIHVSADLNGGYDDNVNLTPVGSPSWFSNAHGTFSYAFGTDRLAMQFIAGAGIIYYFDHPGGRDYDPNLHLRLSAAYRISPRLTLNLASLFAYQGQPDYSTALSSNRRLGTYFRSADTLSLDYQLTPRLSSVTSYDFAIVKYNSSAGAFQNRVENSFGESLRFLWLPTTSVTGGYRFIDITYESTARDATDHVLLVGLDHTFDPHWLGSVRAGVQFRISDQNAMSGSSTGNQTSPYFEGTLRYNFAPQNSLIWVNRYAIEESDVPQAQSQTTFRTQLQLNYGITSRISANLVLSYLHRGGGSSGEDVFDVGPSVQYKITRYLAVDAGYRHSELNQGSNSGAAGSQAIVNTYSRNRYFAGVNISF